MDYSVHYHSPYGITKLNLHKYTHGYIKKYSMTVAMLAFAQGYTELELCHQNKNQYKSLSRKREHL